MEAKDSCLSLEEDQILTEVINEYSGVRFEPVNNNNDMHFSHSEENKFVSSHDTKPKVSEQSDASVAIHKPELDNDYNSTVVKCDKDLQNIDTETLPADVVNFVELNKRKTLNVFRAFESNSVMTDNVILDTNNEALELNLRKQTEKGEKYRITTTQNAHAVTDNVNNVYHSVSTATAEGWMSKKTYTDCSLGCNERNHNSDSDSLESDSAELEIDVDISDTVYSDMLDKAALRKFGISECCVSVHDIVQLILEKVGNTEEIIVSDSKVSLKGDTAQDARVVNKEDKRAGSTSNTVSRKSRGVKESKRHSNKWKTRLRSSGSKWTTNENLNAVEKVGHTKGRTELNTDRKIQRKKHNKSVSGSSQIQKGHQKHHSNRYICSVCLETFENRASLQNHKANVHSRKIFQCVACNLWFSTDKLFDKHNRKHSNDRPYKCSKCSKSFKDCKDLTHHLKIHGEKRFACRTCGKAFVRKAHLEAHEHIHTNSRPFKCTDCDKAYRYDGQLRIHRRYHTGQRFYCDICQKGFVDKADMKRHLRVHEGKKDCESQTPCYLKKSSNSRKKSHCNIEHICTVCLETFNKRTSLQNHQRQTHDSKIFHCDDCSLWFPTSKAYNRHNRIHSNGHPYKCSICRNSFKTSRNLIYHLNVHAEKKFLCDVCGKAFLKEANLESHKRSHTDIRPFKCTDCDKAYKYVGQLRIHRRYHTGQRFYCDICQKGFVDKADMKRHFRVHKSEKDCESETSNRRKKPHCSPKYICIVCLETFKDRTSLQNHQEKTHDSKIFHCDDCSLWFPTDQAFGEHNRIHSNDCPYECNICSNYFTTSKSLICHLKIHGEKRFLCDACGKAFIRKAHLEAHEHIHANIRPYKCTDCDKTYRYDGQLRIHLRRHTGQRFYCDICKKGFVDKADMKKHSIVHTDLRKGNRLNRCFKSQRICTVCLEYFNDKTTLENHQANVHDSKIFHCVECDKWFPESQLFDQHSRIHSNDRPYKCNRCGNSFAASNCFIRHLKVHGEKRFACHTCGKAFVRKAHLEAHEHIHTNIRPYKCTDCDKTYRYDGQLRIHMRRHTGQRFYCDICKKGFVERAYMKRHRSIHSIKDEHNTRRKRALMHPDSAKTERFKCDTCDRSFLRKICLNKHIQTHAATSPKGDK